MEFTLCPLYPHNWEVLLNDLKSPAELLDFGEFSDCIDFCNDNGSSRLHVANPTLITFHQNLLAFSLLTPNRVWNLDINTAMAPREPFFAVVEVQLLDDTEEPDKLFFGKESLPKLGNFFRSRVGSEKFVISRAYLYNEQNLAAVKSAVREYFELLNMFDHPNVLKAQDCLEKDNEQLIIFRWVHTSLFNYMKAYRKYLRTPERQLHVDNFSPLMVYKILDIAKGLEYLHRRRRWNGNLDSRNVFMCLDEDCEPIHREHATIKLFCPGIEEDACAGFTSNISGAQLKEAQDKDWVNLGNLIDSIRNELKLENNPEIEDLVAKLRRGKIQDMEKLMEQPALWLPVQRMHFLLRVYELMRPWEFTSSSFVEENWRGTYSNIITKYEKVNADNEQKTRSRRQPPDNQRLDPIYGNSEPSTSQSSIASPFSSSADPSNLESSSSGKWQNSYFSFLTLIRNCVMHLDRDEISDVKLELKGNHDEAIRHFTFYNPDLFLQLLNNAENVCQKRKELKGQLKKLLTDLKGLL